MLRAMLATWMLAGALAAQTVEGHVVSSTTGAGIPDVAVSLLQAGGTAYRATTDSQGRFRIEAVKNGTYTAIYAARGSCRVPNFGIGPPFPVAAGGDVVHLEAKCQPMGKLSGRVLDAAGKPVPNASLWLRWAESWCRLPACVGFPHQAKTNEKGEYNIADLEVRGTWLLSATAPSSWNLPESREDRPLGWAQTFYPGVTDPQLAEEVMVQPGGEIWNLDIKLAAVPVHRIRGVVLDVRGDPVPKVSVALGKGFGPTLHQDTQGDGTFEFASVADAEWRLSAAADQDGVKLWGAQWVRVKGDDLENVKLRLTAPLAIHGKIMVEVPEGVSAPKPPGVTVLLVSGALLLSEPQEGRFFNVQPDDKGDFTIENVYPGPYLIQSLSESSAAPYYLDSLRLGGRDALESDVPILSDALPLTVTYKPGGGSVRGTIEDCGAGNVFLIPQDPALRRGDFIRRATCGPNGRFEIPAVRPGEYYGLAIAADDRMLLDQAVQDDGLLKQASRVSVRANESTSAEIRLIAR